MHPFVVPLAFVILGATDEPPALTPPMRDEPLAVIRELRPDLVGSKACRDRNLPTAGNPGQRPRFERGPATADIGQYIYAVDRRVDGCSVTLAMNPGIQPRGKMKLSPDEMAEIPARR
jgi:hypothetical protein